MNTKEMKEEILKQLISEYEKNKSNFFGYDEGYSDALEVAIEIVKNVDVEVNNHED